MPEDMSRAIRMPDGSYKCEPCQIEEILCLFAKHPNDNVGPIYPVSMVLCKINKQL
jgi:hypothetical protein